MAWAYVAVKDNYLGGFCSAEMPGLLAKFLPDFAKDGYDVIPISEAEWREKYMKLPSVHEAPWFKPKPAKRARRNG